MSTRMDFDVASLWEHFGGTNDAGARGQLVEYYMPLARRIAARIYKMRSSNEVPFDDYLQYARVGLVESVDRFDAKRSASFETFSSYRIRGAVLSGVANETEAAAQQHFWRDRATARVESLEGQLMVAVEEATLEQLAEMTVGLAIGVILDTADVELATEDFATDPYATTELLQFRDVVRGLVPSLPAGERDVIRGHYFEQIEFQELAKRLAISKGRVSQLHGSAISRLRSMLRESPTIDRKV